MVINIIQMWYFFQLFPLVFYNSFIAWMFRLILLTNIFSLAATYLHVDQSKACVSSPCSKSDLEQGDFRL
jgi:hypothetical protein